MPKYLPLLDVTMNDEKENEEDYKPCTYDLLKIEGGAIYLTKNYTRADVIVFNAFKDHFYHMGERGLLRGEALRMYEEETNGST